MMMMMIRVCIFEGRVAAGQNLRGRARSLRYKTRSDGAGSGGDTMP